MRMNGIVQSYVIHEFRKENMLGRTLKRVSLDFKWPLNEVWKGYINPIQPKTCLDCTGNGRSPQVQFLYDKWYGFHRYEWVWCDGTQTHRWNKAAWCHNVDEQDIQVLLGYDRLWDFTRVPRNAEQQAVVEKKVAEGGNSWLPYNNGYIPTPEEVNEWSRNSLGHDGINASLVVCAKAKKLNYPLDCEKCAGEGILWKSSEQKAEHEAWEAYEPPAGEGYQLWETTSEGSPQSPVFASLDRLCNWCELHATTFGDFRVTAGEWHKMLSEDFVHHQEGNNIFL